jgi:hypothetical protein
VISQICVVVTAARVVMETKRTTHRPWPPGDGRFSHLRCTLSQRLLCRTPMCRLGHYGQRTGNITRQSSKKQSKADVIELSYRMRRYTNVERDYQYLYNAADTALVPPDFLIVQEQDHQQQTKTAPAIPPHRCCKVVYT